MAAVWDIETGDRVLSVDHDGVTIDAVAFSPDGTLVATTGSIDCRLWDNETGAEVARMEHSMIYALAFSPDGGRMVTAGWDEMVRLWLLH